VRGSAQKRGRALLRLLPLLLVALAAPRAECEDDAFERARARYAEYLQRPSLEMRTRGRDRFARTADPRALARFARDYGRTVEPRDQERYLIASICADAFRDPRHVPAWRAWRKPPTLIKDPRWRVIIWPRCAIGKHRRRNFGLRWSG